MKNQLYKSLIDLFWHNITTQKFGGIKAKELETWVLLLLWIGSDLIEKKEEKKLCIDAILKEKLNQKDYDTITSHLLVFLTTIEYHQAEEIAIYLRTTRRDIEKYLIEAWRLLIRQSHVNAFKIAMLNSFIKSFLSSSDQTSITLQKPISRYEVTKLLNDMGAKVSYDNNTRLLKNIQLEEIWKRLHYTLLTSHQPNDLYLTLCRADYIFAIINQEEKQDSKNDINLLEIKNVLITFKNELSKIKSTTPIDFNKVIKPVISFIINKDINAFVELVGNFINSYQNKQLQKVIDNISNLQIQDYSLLDHIKNEIDHIIEIIDILNKEPIDEFKELIDCTNCNPQRSLAYMIKLFTASLTQAILLALDIPQ